ncbi:SDR family oxidoreductase [Lewinella sp. 4G2]|uniref:SDR family oxidoreductase n=1 Tax=Lewinella sp. 4G2 TaxID=1803372 RepID=UPI0007B47294|nr:SDR family oxidoreductase [Lewinella sp. 4G2]OAV43376.1 hypothetical protein A3850_002185 [Lewinella sp. 4G2]
MTILITGVSTGIGRSTAEALLEAGHTVYGSARKAGDFGELEKHSAFTGLVFDVTDRAAIRAGIARIQAKGELHAVVNNAGIAVTGPLETLDEAQYRKQFDVNVFGLLAVCQEALPLLHAAREAGRENVKIINVSSVSGYLSSPFTSIYSASKFAVEAITDGMRRELMPYGIDVISIAPGPVKTPIWGKGAVQTEAYVGNRYEEMLGRLEDYTQKANAGGLEPEVIATAIRTALEKDRPRPDQLVMKKGWMAKLVRRLPKRTQDKLIRKNLDNNKRY